MKFYSEITHKLYDTEKLLRADEAVTAKCERVKMKSRLDDLEAKAKAAQEKAASAKNEYESFKKEYDEKYFKAEAPEKKTVVIKPQDIDLKDLHQLVQEVFGSKSSVDPFEVTIGSPLQKNLSDMAKQFGII